MQILEKVLFLAIAVISGFQIFLGIESYKSSKNSTFVVGCFAYDIAFLFCMYMIFIFFLVSLLIKQERI